VDMASSVSRVAAQAPLARAHGVAVADFLTLRELE
jgi:hypothetical protein